QGRVWVRRKLLPEGREGTGLAWPGAWRRHAPAPVGSRGQRAAAGKDVGHVDEKSARGVWGPGGGARTRVQARDGRYSRITGAARDSPPDGNGAKGQGVRPGRQPRGSGDSG